MSKRREFILEFKSVSHIYSQGNVDIKILNKNLITLRQFFTYGCVDTFNQSINFDCK